MPTTRFHPAVAAWFRRSFPHATEPQRRAWPAIAEGRHTLIAAPTGSGKTLSAFLATIDALVRDGLNGGLPDETRVVYVSPLKALSNDIEKNLQQPLAGVREELKQLGLPDVDIRVQVRTGDTTAAERTAMRKQPPHILVTTPESLYLLLTSESGRNMLATTRTAIIDEIHAVAGTKRGSHLALSLERLTALAGPRVARVGLSATQKPIDDVARFLVGADTTASGEANCVIVDVGHKRERDLAIELPGSPLEAVMSADVWEQVYDRLAQLIQAHRTTLIFVNTRRLAERAARHLSERLGKEHITSHHGSMAKESRLDAEQRLKRGELRALVATASLELGIDIGDVDLACQLGSPRSIATFLQRVGRSGHAVSGTPKGRLFPTSRDELIECAALVDAVHRGELDRLRIPEKPLDVLAQQITAEVAAREWSEEALYQQFCRAYPYRTLTRDEYTAVVRMLAEGFSTRRGRRAAYLHRDAVNGQLRARDNARLTALTCGGAIPDTADYKVVLEPAGIPIGTLNEDFAVESLAGDIFQLGNASYRILKIEPGIVRAEDAAGAPPSIPFWLGEAPARTDELSAAVARLRHDIEARLEPINAPSLQTAAQWLAETYRLSRLAADQIIEYLAAAKGVLHQLPTQQTVILERFFDESGGMQLVLHAAFGNRINRAWGLSLRKRFCRKFNFELQAAATDDAIVLSLGESHSFPLEDVARYLHSNSVRDVLIQALLDAPLFTTRWRWNATVALAVRRFRSGRRHPAPLARMDADDLLASVFPDQAACAENLTGEREVPDHPLVKQTIDDCLYEAMDLDGFTRLLKKIETDEVKVMSRDLPHPSPLAQEILNAKPYAFLDDAPLEERRTQAVQSRRWVDPLAAGDLAKLDEQAIARVRAEAWPQPDDVDELHEALMLLGYIKESDAQACGWERLYQALQTTRRATSLLSDGVRYWVAAERLPLARAVLKEAHVAHVIDVPADFAGRTWEFTEAVRELVRGRLEVLGPITADALAHALSIDTAATDAALMALETDGFAMRGKFTASDNIEWCERRLLARIHRYTVERLRAEIEPVTAADFLRFLFEWHGLTTELRPEGPQALGNIVEQLEGYEAACLTWESDILAARMEGYDRDWLDDLCRAGRVVWARLSPPKTVAGRERAAAPVRTTPIALLTRKNLRLWQTSVSVTENATLRMTPRAQTVANHLAHHGASFFEEITSATGLLRTEAEDALRELVALGLAHADSYSGLRALLLPADRRRAGRRRRGNLNDIEDAGRWSLIRRPSTAKIEKENRPAVDADAIEQIARALLRRYGVVFRRVLTREAERLPPWFELLRVYRRLEARGEIRGGRFVSGFAGEQYALPEAVSALRAVRKKPANQQWVSLSAADPLNLVGILTPGTRVSAIGSNRVLYRDGIPVAVQTGRETQFLVDIPTTEEWNARNALRRPWAARRNIAEPPAGSA